MIKAEIKLNNGTLIKIEGSSEEIEKILSLYIEEKSKIESIIKIADEVKTEDISDKIEKALSWAEKQIGKSIQHCNIPKCKYNSYNSGESPCPTPNPAPETSDILKLNTKDKHPYWILYCMRFVRTAYNMPAQYSKAINMYDSLNSKDLIKKDKEIPKGAVVFWYWKEFGHVGIHTENNQIIHTGLNRKELGIRKSPLQDITDVLNNSIDKTEMETSYLGWTYPPKEWLN